MPEGELQNLTSTKSFIEAINQSYSHLFRTLIFFLLVFLFLVTVLIVFFRSITQSAELKAEFNENGGLVFEVKKSSLFSPEEKKTFATFLLPSNVVWFDTGLELDPNQECTFKISGSAHLAIHTVVNKADKDQRNSIPWTDANGNEWVNIGDDNEQLNAKKQLLLKPGNKIGNVLGYYVPSEETNDFKKYFIDHRRDMTLKIFEVNNEVTKPNTTTKRAKIYLSVNDILMTFDSTYAKISEIAYTGKQKKWSRKWKEISSSNYDNLYYDDNIGSFLVHVEIKNKE